MANYLSRAGGTVGGQPWSVSMQWSGSATLETGAAAWDAAWVAMWGAQVVGAVMPSTTVFTFTWMAEADQTWHQGRREFSDHNTPGRSGFAALPPQMCYVTEWLSATATRAGRGRWYLPGPSISHVAADGAWVAADLPQIAADLGTLITAVQAVGLAPVLVSMHQGKRTERYSTRRIIAGELSSLAAVQTRRGDKFTVTRVSF